MSTLKNEKKENNANDRSFWITVTPLFTNKSIISNEFMLVKAGEEEWSEVKKFLLTGGKSFKKFIQGIMDLYILNRFVVFKSRYRKAKGSKALSKAKLLLANDPKNERLANELHKSKYQKR